MNTNAIPSRKYFPLLFCFFCSGVSALCYQVAWVKALGLIFGHTVYAIATVLAVFMAGLAAGSIYLGSWRENKTEPVVLYAWIELLVAATGIGSLAGLAGVHWLYVRAYPTIGNVQPLLLALRFFGATAVLFLPTFLMGGTLPILARITRNSEQLGIRVSLLYWLNAVGAVVGTLASGFVLLPELGLRETIASAAVLNVISGLIALRIAKNLSRRRTAQQCLSTDEPAGVADGQAIFTHLLLLFSVVGCTAFMYEIAWTRLLSITVSSSTYAFTLMLATFLVGTAIGSAFFHYFLGRSKTVSVNLFSWTQTFVGIAALSSLAVLHWILSVIPPLLRATHRSFGGLILAQCFASALTVLPIATIFGFTFPLVVALFARTGRSSINESAVVGRAYAANTVGAIVGSIATGFFLIPWLGSFRVISVAAGLNLVLATATSWRRVVPLTINMLCLLAALLIGSSSSLYNRSLLSLSAVLYGNDYQGRLTLSETAATSDLIFAADGVNDSVAVLRSDNFLALRVNGKIDASTGDARTQLLLGHLGAAFQPAPRHVLIIGFGSGMTASAIARYPDVEKIDCVEIERAVVDAAPYLRSLNRDVLQDSRIHVIFDDARNFLLTTREDYDLIVSEPSNPWISGVATLFTDEYYSAIRRRLTPGGRFVQWLQAYSLAPADLKMVVATLVPHFADVTLWRAAGPDLLLLARNDPTPFDFDRLRSLWANRPIRDDFESIDVQAPEGLVAYYLLDDAALRKMADRADLNTDDRTLLEYRAPRTMLTPRLFETNMDLINEFRNGPLPVTLRASEAESALLAGSATAIYLGDPDTARKFFKALESQPVSTSKYLAQGRFALARGAVTDAVGLFEAALKRDPSSLDVAHWLAIAEHRAGDESSARARVDEILKRDQNYLPALTDKMEFAADRQDWGIALLAQLNRMAVIPDPPASEYCRLGAIWMKMPNVKEAEPVLLKGIAKDPYSYVCHLQLGELYREAGRLGFAREHFEFVVRFYPDYDASIFVSLAAVYLDLGDAKSADAVLKKGRRLFPTESEGPQNR